MLNAVKNFAITFCISLIIFGLIAFIVVELFLGSSDGASKQPTGDSTPSSSFSASDNT